jgi:LacI family transcriptional regulator
MKVRLKDVAARAGVAINTASTILNRRPNSWASKETEKRVFVAAEELGYKPNRAAVALRSGKFNSIALLLPDLHNPSYCLFADLLEREAEKRLYDTLIESWRMDLARERHCLGDIIDREVDGVAAVLSDHLPHRDFLAEQFRRGRPFVALSQTGGAPLPVDSVLADFNDGLREAIQTLFDFGHRRFGFICALASGQCDLQRQQLFREMIAARSLGNDAYQFVRCDHTSAGAYQAAMQLLNGNPKRPTAIIAMNDLAAISTMRAAAELAISIPRDLSLVGVDDIPMASYLPVSLTSIAQPLAKMAEKTCTLLFDRIQNPKKTHIEQAVFPTTFVPRESIGHVPAAT